MINENYWQNHMEGIPVPEHKEQPQQNSTRSA